MSKGLEAKKVSTSHGSTGCILPIVFICCMGFCLLFRISNPIIYIVFAVLAIFFFKGSFIINPNEAFILQMFGNYSGTVTTVGWHWVSPLYNKTSISLRIKNFETQKLKVNDHDGSPIEVAAVVSWNVVDTYKALFNIDSYQEYLKIQTEAALRNLTSRYNYDSDDSDTISLRRDTAKVGEELKKEIQSHVDMAGLRIIQAQISYLAYAPEIASAMLQRQQANAIIAARQKIVEGAVGMTEMALKLLEKDKIIELQEHQKVEIVSNLLVVLCSHSGVQPVIQAKSELNKS